MHFVIISYWLHCFRRKDDERMREERLYNISLTEEIPFRNRVDYCIGTGRMGLALHKEYYDQLKLVQDEIGFSHIRGHGLFCDDMAIYHEYKDADGNECVEYNYTYIDRVFDDYLSLNIKPFLELGFMPEKLASGTQTIFYWKGNTTPPKDYDRWCDMVQSLLKHLMKRYGVDEVVTWPIEVWNEPNLPGFWKGADKEEYFKLFEKTFYAIKQVDERFRVGGPAVCGGSDEIWIEAFMEYCNQRQIPVDFITRHHYTTEFPQPSGHYGYAALSPPEDGFRNLETTREIIDRYPQYTGLEIHITEFNTSYIPNCPLHDTNQNAAYIAEQLSRLGDVNESYSYWTFGDVFEEQGVPYTPFHGGFGLVANGCIPKPTFWTFQFFKQLQGTCVHRSEDSILVRKEDGTYCGVAWNRSMERTGKELSIQFRIPVTSQEKNESVEYVLVTKTVDETTCNPLKLWHDLGEPASLSKVEKELIVQGSRPFVQTNRFQTKENQIEVSLELAEHAVIYFEVKAVEQTSDRGYEYQRVMQVK